MASWTRVQASAWTAQTLLPSTSQMKASMSGWPTQGAIATARTTSTWTAPSMMTSGSSHSTNWASMTSQPFLTSFLRRLVRLISPTLAIVRARRRFSLLCQRTPNFSVKESICLLCLHLSQELTDARTQRYSRCLDRRLQ